MKMSLDALKALKLKLAECRKANGAVAEHESTNSNCHSSCAGNSPIIMKELWWELVALVHMLATVLVAVLVIKSLIKGILA